MAYNINRLTLYALISAIEDDLRQYISCHITTQKEFRELLTKKQLFPIEKRAKLRQNDEIDANLDHSLLYFTDFADNYTILNRNRSLLAQADQDYFQSVTVYLDRLSPIRNRVMHTRPLEIEDFPTVADVAKKLCSTKPQIWRSLSEVMKRLEENPGFVLSLRIDLPEQDERIDHNLPIPDFDETGFLGREKETAAIKKKVFGPYPVITIVGEGGVGKTALALKVAYDLLDDPACEFEAIVWISSKTQQITPTEIIQIKDAISDSIGVFGSIASALGGSSEAGDFAEILEYLAAFKILLIVDNLENVLDQRIKDFLSQLPFGSKVLITSRISIGAYDYPFPLHPLSEGEGARLLQSVALSRNLDYIYKSPKKTLIEYCRRLKCNPGFIKWFVSAVAFGERPEKILADPKMFLQYCMDNIYHHFSLNSITILNALLSVAGRHTFPMIQYLTEMDAEPLEIALQELLSANFIRMESRDNETVYQIAELANLFLRNYKMPRVSISDKFIKRKEVLFASSERQKAASERYPYNPDNISITSISTRIVAKHLSDAISFIKRGMIEDAEKKLDIAKAISHDYSEVYRIEAWLHIQRDLFPSAKLSYELALQLAPDSAPLRLWFAGFLSRYQKDLDGALTQLSEGKRLDPESVEFDLEICRVKMYCRDYNFVHKQIEEMLSGKDTSEKNMRKLYNLKFQARKRFAEDLLREQEYQSALNEYATLREDFERCPVPYKDTRNVEVIRGALEGVRRAVFSLEGYNAGVPFQTLLEWYSNIVKWEKHDLERGFDEKEIGRIERLVTGKSYGFIKAKNGEEYFFHRNHLTDEWAWEDLDQGSSVRFSLGRNAQGECAVQVEVALPQLRK